MGLSSTRGAGMLGSFGVTGIEWSGRIMDATDEKRLDTADNAEISAEGPLLAAEAELCARLRGPSEDLRFEGSNDRVRGGSLTVATPSYCIYQYMHQAEYNELHTIARAHSFIIKGVSGILVAVAASIYVYVPSWSDVYFFSSMQRNRASS
jgi:hypothetical protein